MRYSTAGESHGKSLVGLLEGFPYGVKIATDDIRAELQRRREGFARGERQKFEADVVEILAGVHQGITIGSPIALTIQNSEWLKWQDFMSPDFTGANDPMELFAPRPGHADLVAIEKYGYPTARLALERSSARETAMRVALGTFAKALLFQATEDIGQRAEIISRVAQFGGISDPSPEDIARLAKEAGEKGETIGGVVEVIAKGIPRGLGTYTEAHRRMDARLSSALMSIQAVKAVEIGDGFALASTPGSLAHDEIYPDVNSKDNAYTNSAHYARQTNHAGGIEAGITNGEDIIVRACIKPIPSVPNALKTIDIRDGSASLAHSQRSDASAVEPAAIVAEAMVALTLADALTEVHGSDSLEKIRASLIRKFH